MSLPFPLPSLTLAGGLATTSYVLFSNLGLTQMGVIPYLNGRLVGPITMPTKDRVVAWRGYWMSGATWSSSFSFISALLNFTTSYTHPSQLIRRLALASACSSLLVLPITLVLLHHINMELFRIIADDSLRDVAETSERAVNARKLMENWEKGHWVRHVAYIGGWVFSFTAVVLRGI